MKTHNNPCWRCGKERVFVRSWEEKVGLSVVVTTETACPDPECQKMVEKDNKKRVDRFKAAQTKRRENLSRNGKNKKTPVVKPSKKKK